MNGPTACSRPALILGSSSPRRRDLLATVGLKYEVIKPETPEIPQPGEAPRDYVRRNAREKAEWVEAFLARRGATPRAGWLVITADTIVVLAGKILEKPRDAVHAEEMVASLGGKTHTVISGVMLRPVGMAAEFKTVAFESLTDVTIKPLTTAEIRAYVATGEPLDKAGGYAAQGIGSYMVNEIRGSYTNVVGLPVADVVTHLERSFKYDLWTNIGG